MLDSDQPADLVYSDGEYHVRKRGQYVICAVSGRRIHLSDLRYWSVARQEPYATPALALQRHEEVSKR